LTTAALGQARIEALTGTLDSLTVELEALDTTYTSFIFILNVGADGKATIRDFEDDATLTEASFDIGQNGENFFGHGRQQSADRQRRDYHYRST
jgi:hypothetical protein